MNMSKMSFGKIIGIAGGVFVLLMVVTVLLLKMQSGGASTEKRVTNKPAQVAPEPVAEPEPDAFGQVLFEEAAKAENEATKAQLDLLYKSSQTDIKTLSEEVSYLSQRVLMLDKQVTQLKLSASAQPRRSSGSAGGPSIASPDALSAAARRAGYDVVAVVGQRIWVRQGDNTDSIEMSLEQLLMLPAVTPKG